MKKRPLVAVTMGDPSGIGPEVAAKALLDQAIYEKCCPFVVGNSQAMKDALALIGSAYTVKSVNSLKQIDGRYGTITVLDSQNLNYEEIEYGRVSPISGQASVDWILQAGELAARGDVQAIATAPINLSLIHI